MLNSEWSTLRVTAAPLEVTTIIQSLTHSQRDVSWRTPTDQRSTKGGHVEKQKVTGAGSTVLTNCFRHDKKGLTVTRSWLWRWSVGVEVDTDSSGVME